MKRQIVVPLLIIICILLLFSGGFSRVAGYVQQPLVSAGTSIFRWVYFAAASPTMSIDEIENLIEQRNSFAIDQAEYEELVDENEELRALLGFSERTAYSHIPASIIARSPLDDTDRFVIDKGESEGVKVGLPVVIDDGFLIGKVTSVTNENATVTGLTHIESATAVSILNLNKTIGLLEGEGGSLLSMSYIPQDQELETNDLVVTSGLEEYVPGGLLVGVINAIQEDSQAPFKEAVVEPLADAKQYSRVFVILESGL